MSNTVLVKAPKGGARIASTWGAVFSLESGEERTIPAALAAEAAVQGCSILADDDGDSGSGTQDVDIETAIRALVAEGNPDDFTKGGQPKKKVVEEIVGGPVSVEAINEAFAAIVSKSE